MLRSSPLDWLLLAMHVPPSGSRGGIVRYTVELAQSLATRSDVRLTVLTAARSRDFFVSLLGDDARVLSVPTLPGFASAVRERHGIWRHQTGSQWDVVHGAKHLLPARGRCTTVLTIHDMLLFDRPLDQSFVKRHLLRDAYLSSIDDASLLICVSEAARDRLCAYVPSARSRSSVVELATSHSLFEVAATEVEPLVGKSFVLVVGDTTTRKNIDLVLRLWPQVVATSPDAKLVLIGPGVEDLPRSEQSPTDPNVRDSVTTLGRVSDEQLKWCYENAAVVACPSVLEGFGFPAREALDLGASLITSEDAALCEVSRDRALHLWSHDLAGWRQAISLALRAESQTMNTSARRTWDEVAEETVRVVRDGR